jgi:hypothetical protein
MTFAVIPTRTERKTFWPLIDVLLEAGVTPVIVRTWEHAKPVPGAIELDGWDKMSITYWWNLGIDYVTKTMPTAPILVLNDDLGMSVQMINELLDELENNDLIWSRNYGPYVYSPFSGACFGLRAGTIRLDEQFVWWHGDDDLYHRAKQAGLRLKATNVEPIHVRANDYENWGPTMFADDIPRDNALFVSRWGEQ